MVGSCLSFGTRVCWPSCSATSATSPRNRRNSCVSSSRSTITTKFPRKFAESWRTLSVVKHRWNQQPRSSAVTKQCHVLTVCSQWCTGTDMYSSQWCLGTWIHLQSVMCWTWNCASAVGGWGRTRKRRCVGASLLIHFSADNCTSGFLTGWFCLQVFPAVDCIYCACCWRCSQPCSCFQQMLVWGLNTFCWNLCIVCTLWTACIRTGGSLMTGQALGLWYLHLTKLFSCGATDTLTALSLSFSLTHTHTHTHRYTVKHAHAEAHTHTERGSHFIRLCDMCAYVCACVCVHKFLTVWMVKIYVCKCICQYNTSTDPKKMNASELLVCIPVYIKNKKSQDSFHETTYTCTGSFPRKYSHETTCTDSFPPKYNYS